VGDITAEANFALRTPLKNYFMHELPDQIGSPENWRDEFTLLIESLIDCDTFFITPAKFPHHPWEEDCCVQRLGFASVSREKVEDYLVDLTGDNYICSTDLYEGIQDEMSFGQFVDDIGTLIPTVRLFAQEYFLRTSHDRFSLDPIMLVFGLPPEVRPLAVMALERDRQKNLYTPSLNRDHLTARVENVRLHHLMHTLDRAMPSMGSLMEIARAYRIKKIKPLVVAYRALFKHYVSVWVNPATILKCKPTDRPPKIIGNV